MKRKIAANTFLGIGVILALAAVMPVTLTFGAVKTLIAQVTPVQARKPLTKTVSIGTKGIMLRYPEGWSVGQPTLNSWVIQNVPAGHEESVKPTVRVLI